ncbi:hypothetical protein F5882DRAFT_461493 [Hyaloscypha sp. PMI_1271]|nr:hypothetical protein F5882DRAFT_461493 [Hyaloscypha sp. PMI_1271]
MERTDPESLELREPEKVDFAKYKVTELREMIKERGLKAGGRLKAELVAVLEEDEAKKMKGATQTTETNAEPRTPSPVQRKRRNLFSSPMLSPALLSRRIFSQSKIEIKPGAAPRSISNIGANRNKQTGLSGFFTKHLPERPLPLQADTPTHSARSSTQIQISQLTN